MRILALSDIHGATDELEAVLRREQDYDLVLVAGDITDQGLDDPDGVAEGVLGMLDEQGTFVKAVPGNMDDDAVLKLLIGSRMNLHKDIFSMADLDFVGFGGGRTPGGNTAFEPDDGERGDVLRQLLERTTADRRVIVSHEPPANTRVAQTGGGADGGSAALRDLLQREEVALTVCGHIHEAHGEDRVGGTRVVNPGPVKQGRYATIDMEDGIDVELHG